MKPGKYGSISQPSVQCRNGRPWELVSHKSKLEDHPLLAVCDYLNIFTATFPDWRLSPPFALDAPFHSDRGPF